MNIELSLMELNELYYAMNVFTQRAEQEAKDFPSEFFDKQLSTAKALTEKLQTALWDECKVVDEAVEYVFNMTQAAKEDRLAEELGAEYYSKLNK